MYTALSELARTWLFVPGDRPEMFQRAVNTKADAVIFDLEDAVLACNKGIASRSVLEFLDRTEKGPFWVRPSGIPQEGSTEFDLWTHKSLSGLVLPKVESVQQVMRAREIAPSEFGLVVTIESARGLVAASQIARTEGVSRLCFGSVDFLSDVGATSDEMIRHSLMHLVIATQISAGPPPIAGVTLNIKDVNQLEIETKEAISLGCFGKLCIHPSQVATVNTLHKPSEHRIAWAHAVISLAGGKGVFVYEGKMIDAAVLREAESILSLATRAQ